MTVTKNEQKHNQNFSLCLFLLLFWLFTLGVTTAETVHGETEVLVTIHILEATQLAISYYLSLTEVF